MSFHRHPDARRRRAEDLLFSRHPDARRRRAEDLLFRGLADKPPVLSPPLPPERAYMRSRKCSMILNSIRSPERAVNGYYATDFEPRRGSAMISHEPDADSE